MRKLNSILDPILARMSGKKHKPIIEPEKEQLPPFDPGTPLLSFGNGQHWTLNDAYQGVQIMGGIGSGKTSGSGEAIALTYLLNDFGGIVFSAKPDELERWQRYCEMCGRELKVIGPGSGYFFNFLAYEHSRGGLGAGLTDNVAGLFVAIAEILRGKSQAMEAYWMDALRQLLRRSIDLITMANVTLSLSTLLDLIFSAPQSLEEAASDEWKRKSFCAKCIETARGLKTPENEADLEHTVRYWVNEFAGMGQRTRSSIISVFSTLADGLVTGPVGKLFNGRLNLVPEETHAGQIIFVNIPIEVYNEVGVAAQAILKYCWQRATARREPEKDGGIPTFMWADESQYFVSNYDMQFQATARSKRACTVLLTQNLPTYFDRIGQDKTNALLGNLQTKIFHANGCHATNSWAAETIARSITRRSSTNVSSTGMSFGSSEAVDYKVPPGDFQRLRKGGPESEFVVDAYIFQAGRIWPSSRESYLKVAFRQNYQR